MATQQPRFSIVIPTLNEEKYLPELLADLATQTQQNFEVLVVDAHSDDATTTVAKTFAAAFPLTILNSEKRNVSHQRNLGIAHAKSEWIVFMDADNELPNYFMQGVAYQLEKKPETDIFTCWTAVTNEKERVVEVIVNLFVELYAKLPKPQALGALIGCRKVIFNDHQFDESQSFMEDGMLIKEVVQAGHTFSVFREPRWYISMRRVKKDGTIKLLTTTATYQIRYLLGGNFSTPESAKHYPMLGGSYYETDTETVNEIEKNPDFFFLKKMQHFITSASANQLDQAKKLLQKIKDAEF